MKKGEDGKALGWRGRVRGFPKKRLLTVYPKTARRPKVAASSGQYDAGGNQKATQQGGERGEEGEETDTADPKVPD